MIENEKWDHIAKHRDKQRPNRPWIIMLCMFVLFCSALVVVVFAAKQQTLGIEFKIEYEGDKTGLTFILNDDQQSYTCTGFKPGVDTWTQLNIPNEYKGLPVTKIDAYAFQGTNIMSISIPTNITYIGFSAFAHCPNVSYVYYNAKNAVTEQGWFGNYQNNDWYGVAETVEFVVGDDVEVLNSNLLIYNTNVWSLTIGKNVKEINSGCCMMLPALNELNYNAINAVNASDTGNGDAGTLFMGIGCDKIPTTITIGNEVESIPDYCFCQGILVYLYPNNIARVIIGENVQDIGVSAFLACTNLTKVANFSGLDIVAKSSGYGNVAQYANEVTTLDSLIFVDEGDCWGVSCNEEIDHEFWVVPGYYEGKPVIIEDWGFSFSNCSEVIIQDGVESIGGHSFAYCEYLTKLTIGESVSDINPTSFAECPNLSYIDCRASLISSSPYDSYVFDGLQLEELKLGAQGGLYHYKDIWIHYGIFNPLQTTKLVIRPGVYFEDYATFGHAQEIVSNGAQIDAIGLDTTTVKLIIPWQTCDLGFTEPNTENIASIFGNIFINMPSQNGPLKLMIIAQNNLPDGTPVESSQDWLNYLNEIAALYMPDFSFNINDCGEEDEIYYVASTQMQMSFPVKYYVFEISM